MTFVLPKPIADYLAADAATDPRACTRVFTDDALVHDEAKEIRGRDAIVRWKAAAHTKYQYTAQPLEVKEEGETVVVRTRLAGNFPGSPVDVDYRFVLHGDLIAELSID